jgi:hypothetical protein
MTDSLREIVLEFTDEKLLDACRNRRGDYTEEAVKVFEDEIARRGLDPTALKAEERTEKAEAIANAVAANLKREDFEPLPYPFTKSGVVTANAVLHSSNIPYTIEKRDGDTELYDVLIYNGEMPRSRLSELLTPAPYDSDIPTLGALPRAAELIEEHFEAGPDGCYALRQSDIVDRIKSFSLYDIKISEKAAMEQVEVGFSEEEKAEIVKLAEALMDEVDSIEEERGRVVFFYDSMEPLIDRLNGGAQALTRPDFLAIIEICQIYCDDPRYNPVLNHIASSILDFFLE